MLQFYESIDGSVGTNAKTHLCVMKVAMINKIDRKLLILEVVDGVKNPRKLRVNDRHADQRLIRES